MEGDLHGKESQEGRQESSQEGQVTRARFQIWFCKGAAATRGAFFVFDGAQEPANHLSLGGRGFSPGIKRTWIEWALAPEEMLFRVFPQPGCEAVYPSLVPAPFSFWENAHSNPES